MTLPKTFGANETKRLEQSPNVSSPRLEVGREYLIRAPGALALGVFTGLAEVGDRTLPRFWPVTWLRGGEDVDPDWPVYAGPRAALRPVIPQTATKTPRRGPTGGRVAPDSQKAPRGLGDPGHS